jgi:hypothetical protein
MAPRPSLKLLVLTGSLSFAAPALHAEIVPGAQSNVTLSLTASFTEENADKYSGSNTIYSGRIVKVAYGNKQLIEAMNDAGDLPDDTVTGWKLVMVNRDPEGNEDDEEETRSFYLVKAGKMPVPVPYLSLNTELSGGAESYSETVNEDDETITSNSKFRWQIGLKGYLPGEDYAEFSMVGLLTGSDKTGGQVKISNQPFKFLYQLVSAKLGGIVGSLEYYDSYYDEYEEELIEGSVSFSAEIPIDISGYPAPPTPIE